MDPIVRKTLLYDFYGELLTEHQKSVFESSVFQDLSYSEIAEELSTSRQAVYDLMRRSEKLLEDYEKKLGLMQRFLTAQESFSKLSGAVDSLSEIIPGQGKTADEQQVKEIRDKLNELKCLTKQVEDVFI